MILSDFDDSTRAALEKILDCEHMAGFNLFLYENGAVTISVDSSDAFEQWLLFQDAVFSEGFDISLYPYAFVLSETENGYCLEFIQDNETGSPLRHKMRFLTVKTEIRCFNYTKGIIPYYEPWRAVANFLYEMRNKRDQVGMEFLNEEEKRLLPLAEFTPLARFFNIMTEASGSKTAGEIFVSYAERAHAGDVGSVVRQYERFANPKEEKAFSKKLQKAMVRIGAEPVHRQILNAIKGSAALYPDRIDSCGKNFSAEQTREHITSFLRSQGFQGDYPSFRKMSALRGLRFLYMGGQLAALWNEKHMASFIDCHEEYVSGELSINYVAGTVLLRKDQIDRFLALSADSGFFTDKDRRRARAVFNTTYWETECLSFEDENLKAAEIASRVSQCARLTRKERKVYLSYNSLSIEAGHFLLLLWVLGGSFFGIMMCTGFVLMEAAAGLIFSRSWLHTWVLIRDTPWHWIFLSCSAGFGLVMLVLSLSGCKRG